MGKKIIGVLQFAVAIFTIVLIAAIWVFSSTAKSGGNVVTAENQIYLERVKLSQTMQGGDFAVVTAELAYLSRNQELAVLEDTTLRIEGEGTLFTSRADRGQYLFNISLVTYGHIEGVYNDLSYSASGDNCSFTYNFSEGKGILKDSVAVRQDAYLITADALYFDYTENSILFNGGVSLFLNGKL
ncbi:MAG: hypothetical protein LBP51_07825 [Deferribacteraceae bacterium]|jgi:hypothetical protein|nr:hypothetical protein [Deferribacteraceae bacterium]